MCVSCVHIIIIFIKYVIPSANSQQTDVPMFFFQSFSRYLALNSFTQQQQHSNSIARVGSHLSNETKKEVFFFRSFFSIGVLPTHIIHTYTHTHRTYSEHSSLHRDDDDDDLSLVFVVCLVVVIFFFISTTIFFSSNGFGQHEQQPKPNHITRLTNPSTQLL